MLAAMFATATMINVACNTGPCAFIYASRPAMTANEIE